MSSQSPTNASGYEVFRLGRELIGSRYSTNLLEYFDIQHNAALTCWLRPERPTRFLPRSGHPPSCARAWRGDCQKQRDCAIAVTKQQTREARCYVFTQSIPRICISHYVSTAMQQEGSMTIPLYFIDARYMFSLSTRLNRDNLTVYPTNERQFAKQLEKSALHSMLLQTVELRLRCIQSSGLRSINSPNPPPVLHQRQESTHQYHSCIQSNKMPN